MYLELNGTKYEVSTNLGTAYEIEKKYNKKVGAILENIDDKEIDQIIPILYIGFKRKNPTITEEEFKNKVLEDEKMTYTTFFREVSVFCNLCVSMRETEEEVRARINALFEGEAEEIKERLEELKANKGKN